MEQRGDRGIGGMKARNLVSDQRREEARGRVAINLWQQAGYAGCRLDHIVIGLQIGIGPVLPKPDAVDIDNVGPDRFDRFVIQPQPLQRLAANIGDKDIGLGQQLLHDRLVIGLLQVERDRTLAVVETKEGGRHARRLRALRGPT